MGPWLIDVHTKEELEEWLGDRPPMPYTPVLMVVRGDGETVREFLPNALDAAKLDDRRLVVWVKDLDLLGEHELREFFLDDESVVAAVLSDDRRVMGWVHRDRIDVDDAEFAFLQART